MKRHLFWTVILCSPLFILSYFKNIMADSVTSGNIGLLIISTSVVDRNRSYGDKLNENNRIIASSASTIIDRVNTIATDTGSVKSRFTDYTSTADVKLAALAIDTGTYTSSGTWTASQTFTSSMTFSSGTLAIAGNRYFFQSTAPQSGDSLLHIDQTNNRLYWGGDGGVAGAATANSTFTFRLGVGGEVFIATNVFIPVAGAYGTIGKSTWNIIDVRPYTLDVSSVARTSMRVAVSSATGGANVWAYRTQELHVSTNNKWGVWYSTAFPIMYNESFALHITTIPASGTLPSNFGVLLRVWKEPEP